MEYFDVKTMKAGVLQKIDDETWFHSQDGTDSRRVEEGEWLLPYDAFKEFLFAVKNSTPALQQNCSNVATELQQNCNSVTADTQQRCSNVTAELQHENSTKNARDYKRPQPTAKELCTMYADEVRFLTDKKNIKTLSKGVYCSLDDLPKSCPRYIVESMNALNMRRKDGKPWTVETVSPLIAAIKINKKPSWFKVLYLICFAVFVSVSITRLFFSSDVSHETNEVKTEQTTETIDKEFVLNILKQNKIQLTDYRINLILSKKYKNTEELKQEILFQFEEMKKAMTK